MSGGGTVGAALRRIAFRTSLRANLAYWEWRRFEG
ncbi:hypothetical protein SAMN04488561_3573 [Jiangella alba]|uniref:Uncharacterized protein n=1 Tax=Jiangella alba TaxID=561176 RepID=A0A1H5MZM0_9ACTN|nr:hypothetical protein SAMN04488561_3573 [Jiangella alba]